MPPDLIIVGAGIFGLWAARHALKRGERVLVLEKRHVGAGASGGFLGSLMPHMPDRWNDKKQMQYEGLSSIGDAIRELEADTGVNCGFRRCGRLMPLGHERMLVHLRERIEGARTNWTDEAGKPIFSIQHIDTPFAGTIAEGWLAENAAPFGAAFDTLTARVNPRGYLEALETYLRNHPCAELREDCEVVDIEAAGEGVDIILSDGESIAGGRVLIANGWEAYPLIGRIGGAVKGQPITGRGVKGQAVLLEHLHGDEAPVLYDSGSYIVPHGISVGRDNKKRPNRIAVGSTSRDDWLPFEADAEIERCRFDEGDMDFLERARRLCPAIAATPITEAWANVRPRNTITDPVTGKFGTEPLFCRLDAAPQISVAVGGFKISFGIAHLDSDRFATCSSPDIS